MKTKQKLNQNLPLAIHKTFEEGPSKKKELVIYSSDGSNHERYTPEKFDKFLKTIQTGSVIRSTAVNATDAVLIDLANRGCKIEYAYWHDTKIAKNLPAEDITAQYALLPSDIFRPFTARPDIAELKQVLGARNAVVQFSGDAERRLKQIGRNAGLSEAEADADEYLDLASKEISGLKKKMVLEEGTSLDKHVERLAKEIRECQLFKEISDIKSSWIMAASFVAYSGGFDRFDDPASLWHYCGQHVVGGVAPKREKGKNIDWNPRMRTILYQLGSTIIKNRENKWRKFYEQARAEEFAVHMVKHPGCKHPDGHSTSRACRKMVKEIVKQFFLAEKGEQYIDNHNPLQVSA